MIGNLFLQPKLVMGIAILLFFGIAVLEIWVLSKITKRITKDLPPSVLLQGAKNALFPFIIVFSGLGLVPFIVIWGSTQPAINSFFISIGVLWTIFYSSSFFVLLNSIKQSGQVLLDVMPLPNRNLVLMLSGVFVFVSGCYFFLNINVPNIENSWLYVSAILLSFASTQIYSGFSRLQIREHGIWVYGSLVKWIKIESLHFEDEGGRNFILKFVVKGRLSRFLHNGVLPVPVEKKDALESLFALHLPGMTASRS
jgi:hypothetical protein